MSLKRESFTLEALLQGNEQGNDSEKSTPDTKNSSGEDSTILIKEKEIEPLDIEFKQDFLASVKRIRELRLDGKTKMDIGSETNKKVMMVSKTLGVHGYALIDVAVSEFLERNKKEIDKAMRQALK